MSKQGDDNQSLCFLFVANAFKKMRLHYETLYSDGFIDQNSNFFTDTLQVYRAWESPTALYSNNQQFLYESFFEEVLQLLADNSTIKNFDDFVEDAVRADGRGHFLAGYDGNENEQGDFYLYRTN